MYLGLGFDPFLKFFFKTEFPARLMCIAHRLSSASWPCPRRRLKWDQGQGRLSFAIMGPRAHTTSKAGQRSREAAGGGRRRFHQLEQRKKNSISNLYIQAINCPLASKESGKAPLPASRYIAQHPFVTSCLEPFRIHLNTGILGFLFPEPGSLAIW